jgi:hypothetical protein
MENFLTFLRLFTISFIGLVGFPLFLLMLLRFPGLVFNIVTLALFAFSTLFLVPIVLALSFAVALQYRPNHFAGPAYAANPVGIRFHDRIRTPLPKNPEIQAQISVLQDTVGISNSACSIDGKQIIGSKILCVGCGRTYHPRCANWLKANGRNSCSCGKKLP